MSKLFLPTLREVPADAVIISHQLMLRAGLIRKVASGIYTYLPLGLRVIKKISAIIEQEMNSMGAQEILMPMVQPAELWRESGRFDEYGPELLRFLDRKESFFCLGPTHEEVVTTLVRDHIKSYKSLPLTLYQIQTKFRDEIRPRFGLMRAREFLMKDAYSFCVDKESQDEVYQLVWQAYNRIFDRCGLRFKAVSAATGSIGGERSHEFQVLADSGEDAIASCGSCGYTANVELAKIKEGGGLKSIPISSEELRKIDTPNKKTIEELCVFLKLPADRLIKSLVYFVDQKLILVLLRGDQELSEAKLKSALKAEAIFAADEKTIEKNIGPVGFIGPFSIARHIKIVADNSLLNQGGLIAGANELDKHFFGVLMARDVEAEFFDIKRASKNDPCGECGGPFNLLRGIEVGHIFSLGNKYSKAFKATVLNEHGENVFLQMGCYGIGVGRTAQAAIEQNHDQNGIIWPVAIAPFQVHLVQLGLDKEVVFASETIYDKLSKAGVEVLIDDRDERAGVKLNDADLIGCPIRLTVGSRSLKNHQLEVLKRDSHAKNALSISLDSNYVDRIKELLLPELWISS